MYWYPLLVHEPWLHFDIKGIHPKYTLSIDIDPYLRLGYETLVAYYNCRLELVVLSVLLSSATGKG